jgi:cobyrinic acid a,c-diamide synthase
VVLVVDAGGMARSLGALIQGFSQFDPDLSLAGVVFNRASGKAHLDWLQETARPYMKPFGGLPRDTHIEIPERHLGLVHPDQAGVSNQVIDRLVQAVESHFDLDGLLRLADSAPPLDVELPESERGPRRCRIALARDEAFHFYYPDNLELLERAGAELIEFSPIHDSGLPEEIHGIYLGGGYPELYARELSTNHTMQTAIRRFAESAGPVYAECGGMMYLAREIRTVSGEQFAMAGIIPGCIQMKERLSRLGYVEVVACEETPILSLGDKARGHEFHYSDWEEEPSEENGLKRAYRVCKSGREEMEGYLFRNILASYIHLHFGSNPDMAHRFVERCEGFRRKRR